MQGSKKAGYKSFNRRPGPKNTPNVVLFMSGICCHFGYCLAAIVYCSLRPSTYPGGHKILCWSCRLLPAGFFL